MAKISLTAANNYARIALYPLSDKIQDASDKEDATAYAFAKKYIPNEIWHHFEKYPAYTKQRSNPSMCTAEGKWNYAASFTKNVPDNGKPIVISDSDAALLDALISKHRKLKAKYKEQFLILETAIIGLGTTKRLKEAFPGLYAKLNIQEGSTALAVVNLAEIKQILAEQE